MVSPLQLAYRSDDLASFEYTVAAPMVRFDSGSGGLRGITWIRGTYIPPEDRRAIGK